MKKDIWIVVIILCILGIAAVVYKVWKDGKDGLLEKFLENYTNPTSPTLNNNLINNTAFDYGRQPKQFSGSNGKFEVVVFPNNGQSSYVLRESALKTLQANEPIYYRMDFLLKPASVYYFGCLYYSSKMLPLRTFIIFNNIQNVLLKTVEEPNYQYTKSGDFKYRYSLFKTPNHTDFVKASIYLGYNFNNMTGYNYFTDLGLYELVNDNVIPVWENLRSYFNAFNIDSIDPGYAILRDLSFHGFDFKATVPDNIQLGEVNLTENVLAGPSAFKLQNSGVINLTNNFSFLIHVKGSKIYQKQIVESFADTDESNIVPIIGSVSSTNPSKMTLDEFQELWSKAGCQSKLKEEDVTRWRTQDYRSVLSDMENINNLTKDCNGTDAQNNLCYPGKCLKKEESCDKATLSYSKLKEPSNAIVTTSEEELKKEMAKIDGYKLIMFPGNQLFGVGIIVPNKYGPIRLLAGGTIFETSVYQLNFLELLFGVVYNGEKIILYLNGESIMETPSPKIHFGDDTILINPDGSFYGNLYSFAYYNKALSPKQIKRISTYFVRMKSVGEEITTISDKMIRYVKTFIISDFSPEEESLYASQAKIMSLKKTIDAINNINNIAPEKVLDKCREIYRADDKKNEPAKKEVVKSEEKSNKVAETSKVAETPKTQEKKNVVEGDAVNCPSVRFEDDHYYIVVPPDSELSRKLGYSGVRDYGNNIDTAKQIFQTNFPKCALPSILDKSKYQGDLSKCPFIITNEENPCKNFDCKGIDWENENSDKLMNKNCKNSVVTYCSKYADLDEACFCWRNDFKDDPTCLKFRGKFESQDKCDFRKADLSAHPDAKNWIRKDKIPCWGCNLNDTNTVGVDPQKNKERSGSGGR